MRLRLEDPALVPDLLHFLDARVDCVVARVGDRELEVSLLGSYQSEAQRAELERRLWPWRAKHRCVEVEFVRPPLHSVPDDGRSLPSVHDRYSFGSFARRGAAGRIAWGMEVRINNPARADDLVEALNRGDCAAARTGADTLEVVFPSLEGEDDVRQAGLELVFFLRAWQARYPGVEAILVA